MAHHGSELPEGFRQAIQQMVEGEKDGFPIPFGATGKFPQGKLNDTDEGEIAFGVTADLRQKKIIINFGKPTAWIGMDAQQAIDFADSLRRKADEILEREPR